MSTALGQNANAETVDGQGFATAVGNSSVANQVGAVALGAGANATGERSTALGADTTASGGYSVALGQQAQATAESAVALGVNARASGARSVAIGEGSQVGVNAAGGIAQGNGARVGAGTSTNNQALNGIALGTGARVGHPNSAGGATNNAIAIGTNTGVYGSGGVAIGNNALSQGTGVSIGQNARTTASFAVSNFSNKSVAIGDSAEAIVDTRSGRIAAIAVGNGARANVDGGTALGTSALVSAVDGVALGSQSHATTAAGVAGYDPVTGRTTTDTASSWVSTLGAVSVGGNGQTRQITNVAAGSAATDAVNVAQLRALADEVEASATHYFSVNEGNNHGGNYDNDGASGFHSIAIGKGASATGELSMAAGTNASAQGLQSVAMGTSANALGSLSVAFGSSAQASGLGVTAVGGGAGSAASNFYGTYVGSASGGQSTGDANTYVGGQAGWQSQGDYNTAMGFLAGSGITASNTVAIGTQALASADDAMALGANAQVSHAGSVALGAGSVADGAALASDAYSPTGDVNDLAGIAPVGEVAVGSAGAERRITNVAAGSADTDAANVSQLKALSEQVNETVGELADTPLTFGGNSGSIARKLGETMNIVGGGTTTGAYAGGNLRTEVDANGDLQLLMAEAPRFGDLVVNADGTGRITGVTAGVNDTDAVNVSQLAEVAQSANAGWNISAQGDNETKVGPGEAVDLSNTDGNIVVAKTADSNDVTFDLADDLVIGNSITVGDAYIDGTGLAIAGGPSVTTAGIDAGGMLISNVGAGEIGAASLEAVNGSQLWGTANSIAAHLGGAAYGVTVNTDGTLSAPAYQIAVIGADGSVVSTTHNNVGDALGGLSESVTNVNTQIANLGDQIGGLQNDALLWDDSKGAYSANHGGTGPNKITDVAAGEVSETSTDAVNGSQLHATNQRVDQIDNRLTTAEGDITTIKGDITNLDNRVTNIEEGVAAVTDRAVVYDGAVGSPKDHITLAGQTSTDGGVTGGTTISNLSQGELSATSTDAVNGAQLHATNQAIETLSDNAVQYSLDANGNKTNKVALLGGDPNAPVLISNVAAGVADTDAANVGQLNEGLRVTLNEAKSYTDSVAINTLNQANQYTDLRFGELNRDIADVRDEARAAAALGLAAGSLRYDDRPGKVSVAVGVGSWRDKGALAWGVGYTSENQGVRANVSASMADGSVGVGAGLSLTLN